MKRLRAGEYGGRRTVTASAGTIAVTETAYAPGAELPDHEHATAYLCFVLFGGFTERCGRVTRDAPAGTFLLRAAGEAHCNHFGLEGARCLNIEIEQAATESFPRSERLPRGSAVFLRPDAALLARKLQVEMRSRDDLTDTAIESIVYCLLGTLAQERTSRAAPSWLHRAIEYLHDNFREPCTLARIARAAGVHRVHLARVFRQHTGLTPFDYLRRLRLEWAAAQLGRPDCRLAAVASAAGFADQAHFTRWLQKKIGATPGEYARNCALTR